MGLFTGVFRFFLSWWGAFLMGALDTSMLFFLPFGIDALVIYLAARDRDLFWLYPLLATAGSTLGAFITYSIGRTLGEVGLARIVSGPRLERLQGRVNRSGAIALAVPALLPPPFPLTPFILTCGALDVDLRRFLVTFVSVRLARFFAEGLLARQYGERVLAVLQSDAFQIVIGAFAMVAVVGTIASGVVLWRKTRPQQQRRSA